MRPLLYLKRVDSNFMEINNTFFLLLLAFGWLAFAWLEIGGATPSYLIHQTKRDEFGPLEDECNLLEQSLERKEYDFGSPEDEFSMLEESLEHGEFDYGSPPRASIKLDPSWIAVVIFYLQIETASGLPSDSTIQMAADNLSLNTVMLASTLSGIFIGLAFLTRWRDTQALIMAPFVVDIGLCCFGNEGHFSAEVLLIFSLFSLGLNILLLKNKLDRLERTGGLTWLLIPSLGVSSAFAVTYSLPEMEGRYSNPVVVAAIGSLLSTLMWSFIWIAFFEKLGIAERLDRGDYDEPIAAFLLRIFDGWIHHLIAQLGHTLIIRYFGERQPEPVPEPVPQPVSDQFRERFDDYVPENNYAIPRRRPFENAWTVSPLAEPQEHF